MFPLSVRMFLYIDPLKQGLKHIISIWIILSPESFLYIDPLKQGLKLIEGVIRQNCI